MSALPVPTVTTVLGEGGSGGALALAVADRVLMLENAVYSVIAPEGAAAILYRDAGRAEELASALKLTAQDCLHLGVVDTIVPEPGGGAHLDHDYAATLVREYLLDALLSLGDMSRRRLVEERYQKYRRVGRDLRQYQQVVDREVESLARRAPVERALEQLRELAEYLAARIPGRNDDQHGQQPVAPAIAEVPDDSATGSQPREATLREEQPADA
jgi:enoyl-CoA hydratase/carnithine racemase